MNQINPEELALCKKLQKSFREVMGEWLVGDRVFNDEWEGAFLWKVYPVGEIGEWLRFGWPAGLQSTVKRERAAEYTWLPAPLDSLGPDGAPSKRCLVGMLGREWQYGSVTSGNKKWYIMHETLPVDFDGTPALALLKALDWQWGREEK